MTEAELFGQINSICSAGLGTTAATLAGALLTLVRHPQQLEMLRENPELIDGAVEECLRFHGPGVNTFTRFAVKETTVAGHKIFKDMPVIASIQAADYDPMEFPDPLRFDITRNPRNIFAFGSGPHHCIGNRLARTILRKSLLAIVQNFPRLRLAESDFDPIYCGFPGELCMTRLPLRID
jgi:cytochrome P450